MGSNLGSAKQSLFRFCHVRISGPEYVAIHGGIRLSIGLLCTHRILVLARILHEHRDASSEKSACQRQGDLVAASPDKVGPSGANIPRLR